VWADGAQPAEERDGANAVLRRFYGEGEQVPGAVGPSDRLFYAKDHLGSVREVTDGAGVLRARYDYDFWGNRTRLSGDVETAVGYTGHHHHAKSGLVLTWYRAYDPDTGRWLSRDPIAEEGGLNLYGYVGNDPGNLWDPLGLQDFLNAQGNAKSGCGVDVSFHSQSVNNNPNSNPRNAWDDGSTFTVMGHGSGKGNPFIKDQRDLLSGDDTGPSVPKLTPRQFFDAVKDLQSYKDANTGILYSCQTGMGKNSFAQQLANLSGKPWWAPTNNLQYGSKAGQSTGISNGGEWKKFSPQKPWWKH
jgi:RHS repeat-associated protein